MSRTAKPPHLRPFKRRADRPAVWAIFWTEPGWGGKRLETGFLVTDPDGLAKAERFFAEWKKERAVTNKAAVGPCDPAHITVSEIMDYYILNKNPEDAVAQQRKILCARPISYFFGADPVTALTVKRSREYLRWRRAHGVRIDDKDTGAVRIVRQTTADATARKDLGCLTAACNFAIEEEVLPAGLVIKIELPDMAPPRERWLSEHEAARLLWEARGAKLPPDDRLNVWRDACGNRLTRDPRARLHLPLFIMIALYTGARCGAILGLKWPQVDLVNDRINFNPPGRKQTKKGRSTVPLARQLKLMLLRAQRRATSEYVVSYDGGRVGSIKHSFNSAVARAGLGDDVTPHTMRHTAATWLAQRGVPLWEVAGYLGHADSRVTDEVYAKHSPDHMAASKAALERRPLRSAPARARRAG